MQTAAHPLAAPLFFQPNRVWRCYTGGLLLDRFLGRGPGQDGYFPEEWLASITRAENGEHSQGAEEGLSRLRRADGSPGPLMRGAIGDERLDVLCKFLDSAVRLPIQCHPDRAFARAHYRSEHGKTESWLILDTRRIDGEEPYLLIGFKPGIAPEAFARAVAAQDVRALEGMLNRIPVEPGDAYLIPGRVPHAIGPGVLMLEVQEPSDWVVQVERHCAGTRLSDQDMWGPLEPDVGLACFDYRGEALDA
ncbi:MAG: class I mannose-6-phosphate isomerase, partial [Planctomycetes bacterium]|nr:class I mannose-6-phosphate isomerase [Planctomycetota bacterium]